MRFPVLAVAAVLVAVLTGHGCDSIPIGVDNVDAAAVSAPVPTACTQTAECTTFIDFCIKPCGVCRAVAASTVSKCQPPPVGHCTDVCLNQHPACVAGVCTLR